jgi:hypothetical protein
MEENSVFENFELQLNQKSKDFLQETAKWSYFLSILGFIGIGFMVLIAIFASTIFSAMANSVPGMGAMGGSFGAVMTIMYLIIAAIYALPVYYLFKFSSNVKIAFKENNAEALTDGLGYLKSHYKFIGILTLVFVGFYVLAIVFAIIGGIAGAAFGS